MTSTKRRFLLRANAAFLGIASVGGLVLLDLRGIVFGTGPEGEILALAPHAAIGFVEAHGLAFILSVLLWHAAPERYWHLAAAATMALLGICNIAFWQIFSSTGTTAMGIAATSLHLAFAGAHLVAASGPRARAAV